MRAFSKNKHLGIFQVDRRRRSTVVPPSDVTTALARHADLSRARTEILLHQLYDELAPGLGRAFEDLGEPNSDELAALHDIAAELGLELEPEEVRPHSLDVDAIVWRNAARTATLTLLDALADRVRSEGEAVVGSTEWIAMTLEHPRFDRKVFSSNSGLVDEEVEIGLQIAARATIGWSAITKPGTELRYGRSDMFLMGSPTTERIFSYAMPSPTTAYLDGTLAHYDADAYYFKTDSVVQPVTRSLYFDHHVQSAVLARLGGDAYVMTAGVETGVVPAKLGFGFSVTDGAPQLKQGPSGPILGFKGSAASVIAIPAANVRPMPEGLGFLLEGGSLD